MGILVKSRSVREVTTPVIRSALDQNPQDVTNPDGVAAGQAAQAEASARETTIDFRVLALIVVFLAFIVIAGIVTEALKIPDWGGRLITVFNVLWPLLLGYFGGEFVAEKTK